MNHKESSIPTGVTHKAWWIAVNNKSIEVSSVKNTMALLLNKCIQCLLLEPYNEHSVYCGRVLTGGG